MREKNRSPLPELYEKGEHLPAGNPFESRYLRECPYRFPEFIFSFLQEGENITGGLPGWTVGPYTVDFMITTTSRVLLVQWVSFHHELVSLLVLREVFKETHPEYPELIAVCQLPDLVPSDYSKFMTVYRMEMILCTPPPLQKSLSPQSSEKIFEETSSGT